MGPAGMIMHAGQLIEILRPGKSPLPSKALPPGREPFLTCFAGTDIHPGDQIRFYESKKTYLVTGVDPIVHDEKAQALKVYYSIDHKFNTPPTPPTIVHNHTHYGHHIENIQNSAFQVESAGATLTANIGTNEKGLAKEALQFILEIIDELNLSRDEKDELRADATSADAQLDSPKPKPGMLKTFFDDICEKVKKGIAGVAANTAVEKGKRILELLKQFGLQAWNHVAPTAEAR